MLSAGEVLESFDGERFGEEDVRRIDRWWAHVTESKVLSFTRAFDTGVRALNEMLLQRVRAEFEAQSHHMLLPGVPMVMVRSDHPRDLHRGDEVLLMPVRQEGEVELMALVPKEGGYRALSLSGLRTQLDVAFATTVHRAQGAVYKHAAMV